MKKYKVPSRPLRLSSYIAFAKKRPTEEAAAIGWDEMRGTMIEIGISPEKVATFKDDSLIEVNAIRGMSDQEAFDYTKGVFTRYLEKLGVDRSVIRSLRFE